MNTEWYVFWAVLSSSLWAFILFRKEGVDRIEDVPPSEEDRMKLLRQDLIDKEKKCRSKNDRRFY